MPRTTTKEQFREMLRNLLIERFELKYRVEPKPGAAESYLVKPEIDPHVKSATRRQTAEILFIDHINKIPAKN